MTRSILRPASLAIAVAGALLAAGCFAGRGPSAADPIRVGVLHSLSGTMAISERSVVEATLLAIDEVNAAGGLLGRRLEPVVRDGQSDAATFAREAERLITGDQVAVTFGCWTSASRKQVRPVVERHGHLLFYPVQYEGLEQSPFIVYTGATPNQQIIPAVTWAFDHLGRRFFLVGSDYVFPRTANAIIRHAVQALGGEVVGEAYAPLGSREMAAIAGSIERTKPEVILNTINGDSNAAFFDALRTSGISTAAIPTVSFSIGETELATIGAERLVGDYAAWNYFQSVASAENERFVQGLRRRLGPTAVASDPMEAAYFGVHLWALSVQEAGSTAPRDVLRTLADQSFPAPEGVVYVDAVTQHAWKTVRIGRVRPDGQFDVVWSSGRPVRPTPFPAYRSRAEWEAFLSGWFDRWGGQWAQPGGQPGGRS
ncbi:MAG TPA: urea ABC transporter substrate-binding protein [Thermoanaerobaculia bacterium]|nr:urea ABC transporter substrate-binding protein [Thermoanaerobaculia bacterium]